VALASLLFAVSTGGPAAAQELPRREYVYFGGRLLAIVPPPNVSVLDAAVQEGHSGSVNMVFTVQLSTPLPQAVSVSYATANGSATTPADYAARSGSLSFSPGITTQTVNVPVNGDLIKEGAETFLLNLSAPAGVALGRASGTGLIIDDEKELYFTVTPCRILDTRSTGGALPGSQSRNVPATGTCSIPASASAVAFIITAVSPTAAGNLRLFPAGVTPPVVSTINFNAGTTRANNGVVKLGTSGQITVRNDMPTGQSTHFLIDVAGYFQ
jgi:hypothetical protein